MRRSSKLPKDSNQLAAEIVRLSTEEPNQQLPGRSALSVYFANIGSKGGKKGGKARAEKLTKRERHEIAQNAAKSRWAKRRRPKSNRSK